MRRKYITNKMQVFYLWLLMLSVGGCVDFKTLTVEVQQSVTLTCDRSNPSVDTKLFWMRIISGHWPEFLGGTFTFDSKDQDVKFHHITTKQEPGTFVLHLNEATLNDTGLYYCVKTEWTTWTVMTGHFVKVKDPDVDISIIIQVPPLVHPGVQTSVKCSLLSNSEKNKCTGSPAIYWFKSEWDETHPSFISSPTDGGEGCDSSPRTPSTHKCFSSVSRNFSDAGIYGCAVAACGHILWGQQTQLNPSGVPEQSLNWLVFPLGVICAALTITVIILIYCICSMKKKTCTSCWNGIGSSSNDPQNIQTNGESLVYSAPTFTGRKANKGERRNARQPKKETIYSDVCVRATNQETEN